MIAQWHEVSLWGKKKILIWLWWWVYNSVTMLKAIELCALSEMYGMWMIYRKAFENKIKSYSLEKLCAF